MEKKPEEDLESDEEEMRCAFCGKKVGEEDFFHCCNCYLCKDCERRGPCGNHEQNSTRLRIDGNKTA